MRATSCFFLWQFAVFTFIWSIRGGWVLSLKIQASTACAIQLRWTTRDSNHHLCIVMTIIYIQTRGTSRFLRWKNWKFLIFNIRNFDWIHIGYRRLTAYYSVHIGPSATCVISISAAARSRHAATTTTSHKSLFMFPPTCLSHLIGHYNFCFFDYRHAMYYAENHGRCLSLFFQREMM